MHGDVVYLITAYSQGQATSVVVHEEQPEKALESLIFALTDSDDLHPFGPDSVVGKVVVDEADRIVVHQANPRYGEGHGWDYEFRGPHLELLHLAVDDFNRRLEAAQQEAAQAVARDWRPSPEELRQGAPSPALSGLEH